MNYHIEIFQPNEGVGSATYYAHAFGDLDTIAYVAKKAGKAIEDVKGNIVLALNEVDAIGGQAVREVVAVTANAKVVSTVLKGELTAERKAARSVPADTTQYAGGTVEIGDRSGSDVQLDANDSRY